MHKLLSIAADTTGFLWKEVTPLSGLPTLGVMALTLGLGYLTGHETAGAIAAGSAFMVGFAVFHETLASTVISMAMLTLGLASATLAGSLGGGWTWATLLLVAIAGLNFSLLSNLSATAGWMGQQCAVFVLVAGYFPGGVRYAGGRAAMVLLGGALQIAVHAATDLVAHRHQPKPPQRLTARLETRLWELWDQLQESLTLRGESGAYTVRLVFTLLLCTALYRFQHIRNGYWLPMTALLVLKPEWTGTLSRGLARMAGTVAGAGLALWMAMGPPLPLIVVFALVLAAAWGCYALQAVNYAMFSLFITLYIVFLFRFGGISQTSAAHVRLLNTLMGGLIALAVDTAWMLATWKRGSIKGAEPAPSADPAA